MSVRMILNTLLILITPVLILAGIILAFSPGKPKPFINPEGIPLENSLSEKTFLTIGGIRQGMFIRSRDTTNPVLLYLHGGMPEYFLSKKYPTGLEDLFTVVWWEQRGSGISYNRGLKDSITVEKLIDDALEITDYLRRRFGKDKIYLMGHSGGTFIGILAAARAPERYHAYIGMAQMTDQFLSETMAYHYMLEQYRNSGNKAMIRKLEEAAITDSIPRSYLKIRDKAMHPLGIGTMRNMNSVITGIFIPSLLCREYTFEEKIYTWAGKARSGVSSVWSELISANLKEKISSLDIPVYFCCGIYDYTVNYSLAREYCQNLRAPVKGFYTFKNSAHSPLFEEPGKMQRILEEDVLKELTSLAD